MISKMYKGMVDVEGSIRMGGKSNWDGRWEGERTEMCKDGYGKEQMEIFLIKDNPIKEIPKTGIWIAGQTNK